MEEGEKVSELARKERANSISCKNRTVEFQQMALRFIARSLYYRIAIQYLTLFILISFSI